MAKRTRSDSPTKMCTAEGCDRPLRAKGLCGTHYNRKHHPTLHAREVIPCSVCGEPCEKFTSRSKSRRPACSLDCRRILRHGYGCEPPPPEPAEPYRPPTGPNPKAWGPLRRALAEGDRAATLALIKADVKVDDGCWIWTRAAKDGYPVVDVGGKSMAVHRLSIEAHLGAPLGSQAAHHMCATSACVNPEHLVPVTHAENNAEMLARRAYISRIRELEEALAEVAPHHELLARLPVA